VAPDGLSENDIAFICANAEDEGEEPTEEEESSGSGESPSEEQEEAADEEDNDDSLSLNDWACAARICKGSDSKDDNDYIIYRGEPFLINGPDLEDWSETTDTPLAPNDAAGLFSMAMHIVKEEEAAKSSKIDTTQPEQVVYCQRATKDLTPYRTEDGPKRDFKHLGIIQGYMRINGHKAHVLLDGGSTLDMISTNFAVVHKLDMFQLKKPIKLQMATSGSCSVINYGARAELHIGELKEQHYFDVVNLDRYHAILGMPFLYEFDIMLNYAGYRSFKLKDRWFPVRDGKFGSPLSREGERAVKPANTIKTFSRAPAKATGKGKAKTAPDKRGH
jgi:hypothetical protein